MAKDAKLEQLLNDAIAQAAANNKAPNTAVYELAELLQGIAVAAQTDEIEPLLTSSNTALAQLHTDITTVIGPKMDTNNTKLQAINDNLTQIYARLGTMATNQTTSITLLDRIAQAVEA